MSIIMFMPWCPIDKEYNIGDITILPFEHHAPINRLYDAAHYRIKTIMATYKKIDGKPIQKAAIIRYTNKFSIDNLTDDESSIVQDMVTLACFASLAEREYFSPHVHSYCNNDCFSLYIQKFNKADFTALTSRRREGRTSDVWPIDQISITTPLHCHTIRKVSLDVKLLNALVAFRAQLNNSEWGRWQSSISCFNQANTDSDNIRHQMEWVLLCGAFEHILKAKSNAKDVANKFDGTFVPTTLLLAKKSTRLSRQQQSNGKSIRYEWMREFYRIRGDFAHGKLESQKPFTWNPLEHLFLATIAFPLVVKSLLNKASKYELTNEDKARIDSFEKFADTTDFMKPPTDQESSLDSHWKRKVDECLSRIGTEQAFNRAWNSLTPEQRMYFDGNSDSDEGDQ